MLYFEALVNTDNLLVSQRILSQMRNLIWILYLHFLDFVLTKFTNLNLMFQSSKMSLHCLSWGLSTVHRLVIWSNLLGSTRNSQKLTLNWRLASCLLQTCIWEQKSHYFWQLLNTHSELELLMSNIFWKKWENFTLRLYARSRNDFRLEIL